VNDLVAQSTGIYLYTVPASSVVFAITMCDRARTPDINFQVRFTSGLQDEAHFAVAAEGGQIWMRHKQAQIGTH
jgi:hypothetical protein